MMNAFELLYPASQGCKLSAEKKLAANWALCSCVSELQVELPDRQSAEEKIRQILRFFSFQALFPNVKIGSFLWPSSICNPNLSIFIRY
jgi:hypothetical protein